MIVPEFIQSRFKCVSGVSYARNAMSRTHGKYLAMQVWIFSWYEKGADALTESIISG